MTLFLIGGGEKFIIFGLRKSTLIGILIYLFTITAFITIIESLDNYNVFSNGTFSFRSKFPKIKGNTVKTD